MRYIRIIDEGIHDWGGDPTYFIEVNDRGDACREVVLYPNGRVLTYDQQHREDEYGALGVMVVDGDDEWWSTHAITRAVFEEVWAEHAPKRPT